MKRRSREDIRIQNLVCKVHFWLHVLDGEEGPIEEAVKWVDCRWVAATNDSQALALFCRRGCVLEFRHIQFFHILSHSSSWDGDIHLEKIKNSYAPLKRVLTYKTSNSHWHAQKSFTNQVEKAQFFSCHIARFPHKLSSYFTPRYYF